jgi:hypothetical protein
MPSNSVLLLVANHANSSDCPILKRKRLQRKENFVRIRWVLCSVILVARDIMKQSPLWLSVLARDERKQEKVNVQTGGWEPISGARSSASHDTAED